MTKAKVQAQMQLIATMNRKEIEDYAVKLSMSDVDDKARKFLNKTIDLCLTIIDSKIDVSIVYASVDMEDV